MPQIPPETIPAHCPRCRGRVFYDTPTEATCLWCGEYFCVGAPDGTLRATVDWPPAGELTPLRTRPGS